jgi:protein-tyrosine phosphatase
VRLYHHHQEDNSLIRVCFVCLGNICRSPTAEGVMQHLIAEAGLERVIEVDSAGTEAYHEGERADERSRRTAALHGVQLHSRGRRFEVTDFTRYDYVLAMDRHNLERLHDLSSSEAEREKTMLLRTFEAKPGIGESVPDPYYGGPSGFEEVFDICERSCRGLLERIRRIHGLS